MSANLKVTYLQYSIFWEDAIKNRTYITKEIEGVKETDLIILPETFTTGFSVKPTIAETMSGESINWMKTIAHQKNAAIMGSLIIKEANQFYNRMIFVAPNGEIQTYDKLHLFNLGSEGKCFSPGKTTTIFEYKSWKIKPIICYDLRFPVAIRNTENYDVLICVANWPLARVEAWKTLLKARAIENQCYVVGVNRIGTDGNELQYPGNSNVYDPLGETLGKGHDRASTSSFTLEKNKINTIREKFPFLNDRDTFILQ